jgi:D-glycero-alpha-D-manno-heptose-7-phosphate kinase
VGFSGAASRARLITPVPGGVDQPRSLFSLSKPLLPPRRRIRSYVVTLSPEVTRQSNTRGVIDASAPVRICDNGGWTDTWFGGPGRILNIAVTPGVEVSIRSTAGLDAVVIDAETFGHRYSIVPRAPRLAHHPLIEAAIDMLPPPSGCAVEVSVRSDLPAGCGTGTSAAVAVALLGALADSRREQRSRRDIAYAAHRLEVDILGVQSGIQDQLSSAFGGINYLEIERYPDAEVHPLPIWEELVAG